MQTLDSGEEYLIVDGSIRVLTSIAILVGVGEVSGA
jgi:hypothetical protein